MIRRLILGLALAPLMIAPLCAQEDQPREAAQDARPLAHMVYFTLAEDNAENREALVNACRKYLTEHEGTVHFSVGIIGEEFDREVNDTEFDIALNLIFRSKEAHDTYQTHPRHLEFIETSSHLWSKVRVFDSYVVTPLRARREGDRPRGDRPREGAAPRQGDRPREGGREGDGQTTREASPESFVASVTGFSGEVAAEVISKRDDAVIVQVKDIANIWRNSRAEMPQVMVGTRIVVTAGENENVVRYLKQLETGAQVRLDLAHRSGERFQLVELNADQRALIAR